ncbi:tellurium resistance protein TerD [Sediminihabitans luteus]|uniref:Tellurium resistance protein TerD n=1 Tax=Sediminihabitans luteus TaxID=1138585 RepID=A0A2M9CBY6_9CELL|nr:TerD family protein [Sediminihabitans luteus]PJJ68584.1 tellurium resistance protein TerD [Sediminihabitans luteus]GII99922.1 tellurium resistance protein TerD [Sediminihabitans luteus]
MAGMARGANVALTREIPDLRTVVVGVGWEQGLEQGLADNLTLAAILCDSSGRATGAEDFVFFNQTVSSDLSVAAIEDALGSDAEQVEIELAAVPAQVTRVVVVLYVNEGSPKRRTLGQLRQCTVRVLDGSTNTQVVASENLATAFESETAVVLGEIYRHGEHWKFKVVGQGYSSGLVGVAQQYGLPL